MTSAADQPRTYPAGVSCWIDLAPPDAAPVKDFYSGLLGWEWHDAAPDGSYAVAALHGRDVAGLGAPVGDGSSATSWTTYFAVADVDASAARTRDLGGAIDIEPVDAGPAGRMAQVRDPGGATFRLWRPGRRLGAQLTNAPGSWNFSDLVTADTATARGFYSGLFDWVFADLGYGTAIQVPGYGDHLESTVDPDIRTRQQGLPDGFADVIGSLVDDPSATPARWSVQITVADRDAAAEQAERLGGSVVSTTEDGWTRKATVRDPAGAEFIASQFTPPEGVGRVE